MSAVFYGTIIGAIVLVFSFFQWSLWTRFFAIIVFSLGYVASDRFLRYADGIPDIFNFSTPTKSANRCRRRQRRNHIPDDTSSPACSVCGSDSCTRGQNDCAALVFASSAGSLGPRIPKVVDDALQEFFNLTLKNYVENWYETLISREDKAFVKQLRAHIRYALCQCFHRIKGVDLSHLILEEILPVAVNHAVMYAEVRRQNLEESGDLEQRVLERLSSQNLLHPTMRSRTSELSYLKRLLDYVITNCADKTLSATTLSFLRELLAFEVVLPAVDAVADPDVVNRILELFFDPLPMRKFDGDLSEKVVLLNRFVDEKNPNSLSDTVVFQIKLSEIIRDQRTLYTFMIYLKSVNAPMNWLQFILSAHDIQEQLNSGRPLSKEDISHLHWQSWELYRNYLHEGGPDRLGDDVVPPSVVNELKSGVEAEPEQAVGIIGQILEQAYQIVYQQVQWRYVTPFCQSAKFMEMVCAARHKEEDENDGEKTMENLNVDVELNNDSISPILPEKRTLLKDSTDDTGSILGFTSGSASGSGSGSDDDEPELIQPLLPVESAIATGPRDLSLWKANLPKIEPRRDPQTGRTMYVYVIEVEATDMQPRRQWSIDRRYREFFVLESKLVEFHGEPVLGGFPLPPKKTFNNKSRAFVESQRATFDQFLKRLLHNPALKGSELLHAFLTSPNELTASFLPDPFKVMKKMPGKLSREKGQNLSSFLQSLVASVSKFPVSNELKLPDGNGRVSPYSAGRTSPFPGASGGVAVVPGGKSLQDKLYNTLYKNNFDLMSRSASAPFGREDLLAPSRSYNGDQCIVNGVYDTLIYLAHKIFQISYLPWTLLVSARCVVRRTFDSYVHRYLHRQLELAMHEERLVLVIQALRELVFDDDDGERDEEQKRQRKENAFAMAKLYFDTELSLVKHIVGTDSFDGGLDIIFQCLQCPRLNKQLFYVLLDVTARELFPELS